MVVVIYLARYSVVKKSGAKGGGRGLVAQTQSGYGKFAEDRVDRV